MKGRRHIDVGSKSVVRYRTIVASGQRSNFHGSGKTAAPSKIHLDHVTLTFGDQTTVIFKAILLFSGGNANTRCFAQLAVAFIIMRSEALFNQNGLY